MAEHRRAWEAVQLAIIAAMLVLAAARWGSVPDRLPIHWNAAGEVDGYGGKFTALLLQPLVTAGIYLLLLWLPRIDPLRANYARFAGAYLLVRVLVTGYLAFVYVVTTLAIGREESMPVGPLIVGAVGVMLIVLGGALGRFERNWFAGIRTPWTLSSERSWVLTHRLGSRVFVAAGVATLIGAVIGGVWAFVAMAVILLPGTVLLVVYSYVVWRNDPDRLPGPPSGRRDDEGDAR